MWPIPVLSTNRRHLDIRDSLCAAAAIADAEGPLKARTVRGSRAVTPATGIRVYWETRFGSPPMPEIQQCPIHRMLETPQTRKTASAGPKPRPYYKKCLRGMSLSRQRSTLTTVASAREHRRRLLDVWHAPFSALCMGGVGLKGTRCCGRAGTGPLVAVAGESTERWGCHPEMSFKVGVGVSRSFCLCLRALLPLPDTSGRRIRP